MRKEFQYEIAECDEAIDGYIHSHKLIGRLKLICFGAMALSFLYIFSKNVSLMSGLVALILLEAYVFLVVIHRKVEKLHEESSIKRRICSDYIDRIDGNWAHFVDKGVEFIDKGHAYSSDLDIFGENSLFQYLNTTKTWHGRQKFARDLTAPDLDREEIRQRQEAVWELSANKNFTVDLQYYGELTKLKGDINKLINVLKGEKKEKINPLIGYLFYTPIFSTIFILAVFFMEISTLYVPAAILLAIHIGLWVYCTLNLAGDLKTITGAGYKIGEYAKFFDLVERKTFECEKLLAIKSKIVSDDAKVSQAVSELNHVIMKIDLRRNAIVYFLLNLFFVWDCNCIYSLKKWRAKYQVYVEGWFEAVGELESLLSLTNLSFVEENACIPKISEDLVIIGKKVGHPLINSSRRVNNDVCLDHEIFIISGSNMSGKTTFLRTIGMNMVLGMAGGFCCGDELEIPCSGVVTSMRVYDDLSEGVSTFYAELERIKAIIDSCKGGKAIFLIDEIFRGTNSADRLSGAKSVVKSLSGEGAIGLITTHDLDLCDIADERKIMNYSFNEQYENDEIRFSYQLHKGKSTTTNAKFLMGKLGITE